MTSENLWLTDHAKVLLNPRVPAPVQEAINSGVASLDHPYICLMSSGTESKGRGHKVVALTRQAILHAAESVNEFYKVTGEDKWINPLPRFHIGGLAIGARCHLSGAREILFQEWEPLKFVSAIQAVGATITSLVPTQVYDLVKAELACPTSLRLILLGGGPIDPQIFCQARCLGWPLLPSYGMTETSALIAGAPLSSLEDDLLPPMEILPHVKFSKSTSKYALESDGLFSGYLWVGEKGELAWEPRPQPFLLDDRLQIEGRYIKVLARESELVKILGETVNLQNLTGRLQKQITESFVICPQKDTRMGYRLLLIIENPQRHYSIEEINQDLLPFERMAALVAWDSFPRSELGKIKTSELFSSVRAHS